MVAILDHEDRGIRRQTGNDVGFSLDEATRCKPRISIVEEARYSYLVKYRRVGDSP